MENKNLGATGMGVYRLQNLDCADCARKFEKSIQKLPGVKDARVNFAAAKLQVLGDVSLEVLQEAARFDNILVLPDDGTRMAPFRTLSWRALFPVVLSGIALAFGWLAGIVGIPGEKFILFFAIVIGGFKTFKKGFLNLGRFRFDMSVLMSVAVVGAILIGEWLEGATVAFLFSVSEWLESYTADKARRSLQGLLDMSPKTATVIRDGREEKIPVDQVEVDDQVLVRPGEKIPVDAVVIEGFSGVNQAPITGESMPVTKTAGSEVFAGTINQTGALRVQVTRKNQDTTLAQIIRLVEEAQNKKVGVQSFMDRFAGYYTPVVMILAAGIMILPPLVFGLPWHNWIYRGLTLLVVACPCALVITTPVVVVSAIGNAARQGVLIKGGTYLERLRDVNTVAFDKTGTLTQGCMEVNRVIAYQMSEDQILSLAAGVESLSEHPLALAVCRRAEEKGLSSKEAKDFQAFPGMGAGALIDNLPVQIGNKTMFSHQISEEVMTDIKELEAGGSTVVLVGSGEKVLGLIAFSDRIRENAGTGIKALQKLKIKTVMLTGDSRAAATVVEQCLGMDEVYAQMLPQDKVSKIEELKRQGSVVMMVGDGINDAPALAAADVSTAMGVAGTDVALETADIALMGDDLGKLSFVLQLSRQSVRIIKQNIAFAIGIKLLAILAVFPGWLTLWIAIMADMGANVLVTLNGMRLVGFKEGFVSKTTEENLAETSCTCGDL